MSETLIVDYTKLHDKIKSTVIAIENKPHVRYIRYMLIKRYSPANIKVELFRLGLSAPHEPNLVAYYMAVIDPVVKKFGLSTLYSDYKSKLLQKNAAHNFAKDILNFRINLGDDLDVQVKFLKFTKFMEVEDLWEKEFYKFYGSASRIPLDENGKKIIDISSSFKNAEKILLIPKRYLIDKMILENVSDSRIAQYCREHFKIAMNDYDVRAYKTNFFNIKTKGVEDKIKSLEIEKNSLESLLQDLVNNDMELNMGEKILVQKQTEQRINELGENIKMLNAVFSDLTYRQINSNLENAEEMFTDIVVRAYTRFVKLDRENDRDVVDPLFKVAKMMTFAHDKTENIRESLRGKTSTDTHSQSQLLELYKKRVDEVFDEETERANKELIALGNEVMDDNIDLNSVLGIEELGVSFEIENNE